MSGLSAVNRRPSLAAGVSDPARAIAISAVLTAGVIGVSLAARVPYGIAALVAACYVPLVFIDLRLGLALWVPLVFLEAIPVFNLAGKGAGLLLVGAWLGILRGQRENVLAVIRRHRRLLICVALFLSWLTLSLAWAPNAKAGATDLWHWYAVVLLFLIVATATGGKDAVRWLAWAFVAGAALSVVLGFVAGGLVQAQSVNVDGSSTAGSRFTGTEGDPNFLAAGLIPGVLIAAGLISSTRAVLARVVLAGALVIMTAGVVATQSRGAALSAGVVIVAAFFFFRGRRDWVLAFVLLLTGIAAAWFVTSPGAFQRLTTVDPSGNGRSDLWTVAARAAVDHPILGVGLNNFQQVGAQYVREPGALTHVYLIVDRPHFVHNVYLQFLAETGLVGFLLFIGAVVACLRAMWLAARHFEAIGDDGMATLSQAVLVGTIGMLASSFFISDGNDKRLWILFALGPALLAAAGRAGDGAPTMLARGRSIPLQALLGEARDSSQERAR